jgi:predicted outer membrane protein
MLGLFCVTKMASAVAAGSGAEDSAAGGGFVAKAMSAGRDASSNEPRQSDAAHIEREINTHLEAIALYEREAASSDAQIRAFAQRILPQLQRHLAVLRSLKAGN